MRILLWHVHGSWTDAFVHGRHEYFLPTLPEKGPWGLGRAGRPWPQSVHEIHPEELAAGSFDVLVLQRPEEVDAAAKLLGRIPGVDIPAVYVEHNTPRADVPDTLHPLGGQTEMPIVHVTHFNRLLWDSGRAQTAVIEHGIRDPGPLSTGEIPHLAFVGNEPVRRWRVTGADLLRGFADAGPVDVFGMGTSGLPEATGLSPDRLTVVGDLPRDELHRQMARRHVYIHPVRWTSLGLSLLEAMHLGMPVIALATTEVVRAVPPEAGVVSTDIAHLHRAAARLLADPDEAAQMGRQARRSALSRYGLQRFLDDWDALLTRIAPDSGDLLTVPHTPHSPRPVPRAQEGGES